MLDITALPSHNHYMTQVKTITVFGASGKVGRLVVANALSQGYTVKAFVHSHGDFTEHPNLTIVKGDIYAALDVATAIEGAYAVISTLGSWGTPKKDVLSAAMHYIVPAMRAGGITRIVSLTGADARASGDTLGIIHRLSHLGINIVAGKILDDSERHISLLERSELDWTVIRSPIMTSRKSTIFTLTHTRPLPWSTITRQCVALALLAELGPDHHSQQALFIK